MANSKTPIEDLFFDISLSDVEFIRYQKKLKADIKTTLFQGRRAEIEIWLMFSYLEPKLISKKIFEIPLKSGGNRKPDVIVVFNEAVFVIEAKEGKTHQPSDQINKIAGDKTDIQNYLKRTLNISHNNFVFIIYYSDCPLDDEKFRNAHSKKVVLLSPKHKDFYTKIIKKLREKAKDVIFSDLLSGQEIIDEEKEKTMHVPCVRGKLGERSFYQFLLSPEILKKITFVHRRYLQFMINEDKFSYQRIINPGRLIEISTFIKDGGYFPNSILINFNRDIQFEKGPKPKHTLNDVEFGYLVLPKKYGYAWIIDGQHRVFGFSGYPELAKEHKLSVIATIQLPSKDQAQLYVDINQNQKAIDKDDIWDLYTQLDSEYSTNYQISSLVKDLNRGHDFFKDRIYIPTFQKPKTHYKINIANIAQAIKTNCKDIFSLCSTSVIRNDRTIKLCDVKKLELVFNTYFQCLFDDKRINGLLVRQIFFGTNNGTDILLRLLNKFKEFLIVSHIDLDKIRSNNTYIVNKLETFTNLIIKGINDISEQELSNYIKQSSSASRKDNAQIILEKSSKYNNELKEIFVNAYLTTLREDLNNEFKSSALTFNINGEKTPQVFKEEILSTISGFLNKGINGYLYLGIRDDGKLVGIEYELRHYKNLDEYILTLMSLFREHIMLSKSNIDSVVEIKLMKSNPTILLIEIKKVDADTISIVVDKKQDKAKVSVYYRIVNGTKLISSSEIENYFSASQLDLIGKLKLKFFEGNK